MESPPAAQAWPGDAGVFARSGSRQPDEEDTACSDCQEALGSLWAQLDVEAKRVTPVEQERASGLVPKPGEEALVGQLQEVLSKGDVDVRAAMGQRFAAWLKKTRTRPNRTVALRAQELRRPSGRSASSGRRTSWTRG